VVQYEHQDRHVKRIIVKRQCPTVIQREVQISDVMVNNIHWNDQEPVFDRHHLGNLAITCTEVEHATRARQMRLELRDYRGLTPIVLRKRTFNHANRVHGSSMRQKAGQRQGQLHFTPTSGSWLNQVEVFFGIITRQAIRRGTLDSVKALIEAIRAFIDAWNDRCEPRSPGPSPQTRSSARRNVKRIQERDTSLFGARVPRETLHRLSGNFQR
jgi:hypothetical protein